jgi:hypothetical protein
MIKEIIVQGGYQDGGYNFNVLETPSKQTYQIEQIQRFPIGKDTYWHGYIKGKEIKTKKFPIDANPRKPGPTKVVKLMQATIQKNSVNFHHLNNGITIIASEVKYDEEKQNIEVIFGKLVGNNGDGVCNGGHTYFSIDQFQGDINDDMLVRFEIIVLDPTIPKEEKSERVKKIAEARNAHNELESITTAHYSGYYDKFIAALGNNSVNFKWYEGDPNAVKNAEKVDAFLAKLTAISPHWYSHFENTSGNTGNHMSSARNSGSVHTKWQEYALSDSDDRNLFYLLPLINDILLLKDEISYSLSHDEFPKVKQRWRASRIWQYLNEKPDTTLLYKTIDGKKVEGFALSHTFATLILGAFRENVWFSVNDCGINLVGWLIDPIKLWHSHRQTFMKDLDNIASTINAPSFGNAFLQNSAIYNYQFPRYEFGARLENCISSPEVIYDLSSNLKYIKCNPVNGEKYLETKIISDGMPPIAEFKSSNSATHSNYKQDFNG